MSINPVDYLVHFSNILMLVAYSVKDILWLRWFAVAAAQTLATDFVGGCLHDNQLVPDRRNLPAEAPGRSFRG
jgi:hypothetical protein